MYLVLQSIRREGDVFSFDQIQDLRGAKLKEMSAKYDFSSQISATEIDCPKRKSRSRGSRIYSSAMGQGNLITESSPTGDPDLSSWNWMDIEVGSAEYNSYDTLCKKYETLSIDQRSERKLAPEPRSSESPTRTESSSDATSTSTSIPSPSPSTAPTSAPPTAPSTTPSPAPALNAQSVPTPALPPVVDSSPFAPSFDCSKASATHEKLICGDRELSRIDVDLSQAYSTARDKSADKEKLKKEQLEWIKVSLRTCVDKSCLVGAYQKRILDLK